jgi:hypothetical protein
MLTHANLILFAQMLCVTNLPPCLFDHTPPGVFDGQGSGHDFYGVRRSPDSPSPFLFLPDGCSGVLVEIRMESRFHDEDCRGTLTSARGSA